MGGLPDDLEFDDAFVDPVGLDDDLEAPVEQEDVDLEFLASRRRRKLLRPAEDLDLDKMIAAVDQDVLASAIDEEAEALGDSDDEEFFEEEFDEDESPSEDIDEELEALQGAALGGAPADEAAAESPAAARFPDPPPRRWDLRALLAAAGLAAAAAAAPEGIEITDIVTCNSSEAGPGALYVCTPSEGGTHDGHEWAAQAAAEMGVAAVLSARPAAELGGMPGIVPVVQVPDPLAALPALADAFFDSPWSRLHTVGVVGSRGKTTTAWLVRGVLEEAGFLTAMVGTIEYALAEYRLDDSGRLWDPTEPDPTLERDCSVPFHVTPYVGKYEPPPSTPADALELARVLAGAADRGATAAVVECSAAAVADGRLAGARFGTLVFTNALPEEAEAAGARPEGSAETEAEESEEHQKARQMAAAAEFAGRVGDLAEGLLLADPATQQAVINLEDPHGPALAERLRGAGVRVLTYALAAEAADVRAEKASLSIWETEAIIATPAGRLQVIVPLVGRTNAANVVAAAAAGVALGSSLPSIVAGIEAVDIIPGRSEVVDEGQDFSVVVDAARSPAQLRRLLDDVRECLGAPSAGGGRLLLIVGCEGTSDRQHRLAVGALTHAKADVLFLTNDNPGPDFPDRIVADVVSGLPPSAVDLNFPQLHTYPFMQDPHRVPPWYQPTLMSYQSFHHRYVIEDRFSAVRVAIGMARAGDVLVVAGKGHEDFQSYWSGGELGDVIKGWYDDRVECRNALSELPVLNSVTAEGRKRGAKGTLAVRSTAKGAKQLGPEDGVDRDELPWAWKHDLPKGGLRASERNPRMALYQMRAFNTYRDYANRTDDTFVALQRAEDEGPPPEGAVPWSQYDQRRFADAARGSPGVGAQTRELRRKAADLRGLAKLVGSELGDDDDEDDDEEEDDDVDGDEEVAAAAQAERPAREGPEGARRRA